MKSDTAQAFGLCSGLYTITGEPQVICRESNSTVVAASAGKFMARPAAHGVLAASINNRERNRP